MITIYNYLTKGASWSIKYQRNGQLLLKRYTPKLLLPDKSSKKGLFLLKKRVIFEKFVWLWYKNYKYEHKCMSCIHNVYCSPLCRLWCSCPYFIEKGNSKIFIFITTKKKSNCMFLLWGELGRAKFTVYKLTVDFYFGASWQEQSGASWYRFIAEIKSGRVDQLCGASW